MKIKNAQLINSEQALIKLKSEALPIKVAYRLNKTIKEIGEKIKFINEQRNDIIMKYGNESDGRFVIAQDDKENVDKFLKDFKEILDIEEELDIDLFDLSDFENVKLSSDEVESISFLFR